LEKAVLRGIGVKQGYPPEDLKKTLKQGIFAAERLGELGDDKAG